MTRLSFPSPSGPTPGEATASSPRRAAVPVRRELRRVRLTRPEPERSAAVSSNWSAMRCADARAALAAEPRPSPRSPPWRVRIVGGGGDGGDAAAEPAPAPRRVGAARSCARRRRSPQSRAGSLWLVRRHQAEDLRRARRSSTWRGRDAPAVHEGANRALAFCLAAPRRMGAKRAERDARLVHRADAPHSRGEERSGEGHDEVDSPANGGHARARRRDRESRDGGNRRLSSPSTPPDPGGRDSRASFSTRPRRPPHRARSSSSEAKKGRAAPRARRKRVEEFFAKVQCHGRGPSQWTARAARGVARVHDDGLTASAGRPSPEAARPRGRDRRTPWHVRRHENTVGRPVAEGVRKSTARGETRRMRTPAGSRTGPPPRRGTRRVRDPSGRRARARRRARPRAGARERRDHPTDAGACFRVCSVSSITSPRARARPG